MRFVQKEIGGRPFRVAMQSVRDPKTKQPRSRQIVLGSAAVPPTVDLAAAKVVGKQVVGDAGALLWVAEQLDVVKVIDAACGSKPTPKTPSLGEMVLAVAVQRACDPGAKCHLPAFLDSRAAKVAALLGRSFSGQTFHRLAAKVGNEQLDQAQIGLARAAVRRFGLATDMLAFDSTNFDTFIATQTKSELARRGHAKSKRADLRVVGLAVLASETGHVPLFHRAYAGNQSDQGVLADCLTGLADLQCTLEADQPKPRSKRTVVRDGGFWSEQLELELEGAGYGSLISLPLSHGAAQRALDLAAGRRVMKPLKGKLKGVRAARFANQTVGEISRTLVVIESEELLAGQKRGIAAALRKAKGELTLLARRATEGRIQRDALEQRVRKALAREHLQKFVCTEVTQTDDGALQLAWNVDDAKRKRLERERLGKRVLCTDRQTWSTERIVWAFRGQWNVEEIFRRSKKGGVVAWGPSFQRNDASIRLHTFATVLGLMLVALARIALKATLSAKAMLEALAGIEVTMVRVKSAKVGRPPAYPVLPALTPLQRSAANVFELERWIPGLSTTTTAPHQKPTREAAA
jgi:hypothetical protein